MKLPVNRIHIGLRTVKTAVAVILSMILVDALGASSSKLIFAMLGAMAAVQPTFRASVESCLTQIIGVLFGALVGIGLIALPIADLLAVGIGIVLVITLYNALRFRFSPSLPCFIVVLLCTTPDIQPWAYAFERIWDTAIGLAVGMLINTLVCPYDNSRQIRATVQSLDQEVITFIENLFDGDDVLPDSTGMSKKIQNIHLQLGVFSNQTLFLRLSRQKQQLEVFRKCEQMAWELVAQMEVLHAMGVPGRLSSENRMLLEDIGAHICDDRTLDEPTELDIVTNYHIQKILQLRIALLTSLG